jgi:hypothetical protein
VSSNYFRLKENHLVAEIKHKEEGYHYVVSQTEKEFG